MSENTVRGKRVFISGPMSGIELNNVGEFFRMEARLRKMLGAEYVYNPAREWIDSKDERSYEECMRECLSNLVGRTYPSYKRIDVMVSLSGYNKSDGAMFERKAARMCGIPILDQSQVEAMEVD